MVSLVTICVVLVSLESSQLSDLNNMSCIIDVPILTSSISEFDGPAQRQILTKGNSESGRADYHNKSVTLQP